MIKDRITLIKGIPIFVLFIVVGLLFAHTTRAERPGYLPAESPEDYLSNVDVSLLTSDRSFIDGETITVDFSDVECCKILEDDYKNTSGVEFVNSIGEGLATYQADGFASHINTSISYPMKAEKMSNTKVILGHKTSKVGLYIQSGAEMDFSESRPAKKIIVSAYNGDGDKIFSEETDTCLGLSERCRPHFIGVEASSDEIKSFEISMEDGSAWVMDDLKIEGREVFHVPEVE